jgi:hypothetical protein
MKGERSEGWAELKVENKRESWNADRKERISCCGVGYPLFLFQGLHQRLRKMTSRLGFYEEL